jgi:transcriptional regulator with XRE-family HTH domain
MRTVGEDDHPTFASTVASNLKRLREAAGLSQNELAQNCYNWGQLWNRDTVASIEAGRRAMSLEEMFCVVGALGVAICDLLDGDGVVFVDSERSGDLHPVTLAEARRRLTHRTKGEMSWLGGADSGKTFAAGDEQRRRVDSAAVLGIEADEVDPAARRLWRRSFSAELQRRSRGRIREGARAQHRAALQATILRGMYRELRVSLESG